MSTTTATFETYTGAEKKTGSPAASTRKSFYERFIEARMRQGKAHARVALVRMSDGQLAELGFSADQIREMRATSSIPVTFWA
ncbi:MAG: hypothetical protein AB7E81_02120 [Hyphomicrobiaceae bacterium]